MSQPAKFSSFKAALVLVTVLVTIPTQLNARASTSIRLSQLNSPPIPAKLATPDANKQPLAPADRGNLPGVKPATGTIPLPTTPKQLPAKPPVSTINPTQQPVETVVNLTINLKDKRVYVYKGDKLIAKYPVAIGKKGWETPTGEWQVLEKIKNPSWTSFKTGQVFSPRVENILGARWIGFWTDGQDVIGFHGTPNLKSIGTAASHGCVRMYNRDVKELYKLVKVGTSVKVVSE
jgi:lipoprotein-anchoring transpeptidase ErfK/SrfK